MKRESKSPQRRKLQLESLEQKICLTASAGWDGPGRGSAELTYTVGTAPASVGQANFESAIETALKAWSDVADIEFVKTTRTGLNDSIDFTFRNIDGRGGVLAQAYLPDDVNRSRIAGDVQFDSSESWEIGNARGGRATDLVWVAVHEIGHSLGLEHDHDHDHGHDDGAVMASSVSPYQSFRALDSDDVDAVLELYAANDSVPTPTATPTPSTPVAPSAGTPTTTVPDSGVTDPSSDTDSSSDTTDETEDRTEDDADEERRRRRRYWHRGWRGWNPWNAWRVRRWFRRLDLPTETDQTDDASSPSEETEKPDETPTELADDSDANRPMRSRVSVWRVRFVRWR